MGAFMLERPSGHNGVQNAANKRSNWRSLKMMMLAVFGVGLMLAGYGCSGGPDGGSGDISSQVVTGVAAVGDTLAGEAIIKDSSGNERKTVIGNDGSYAIDVTGMTGPFILRAVGSSRGVNYRLHSFASGPGTANINPLANILVANAAEAEDPDDVYERSDRDRLRRIENRLPQSVNELLSKLKPLLRNYAADDHNPISGHYKADHTHLDGVLDDVKISLDHGILTITNKHNGDVIFTGKVTDILRGYFNPDENCLPRPGTPPVSPSGFAAIAGANQVTLSWTAVGNATAYNIYWSKTAGVTKANGTKVAGATNPYIHSGLTAATAYYYIITAVNGAGESAAAAEVSATTTSTPVPPTVPAAPTGLSAAGGTKQVTLSWSAVSSATSYNIYWSTTSGVTKANGSKITGATSPAVHTGLSDGTTYYYIVTAVNSTGEGAASVQAAATTITPAPAPTIPAAPAGMTATGGTQQVTLSWSAVAQATSYNIYWSTTSGVTKANGTRIAGVTSPYVQTGLSAGTTYYYIVTAANSAGESAASSQVSATTAAPLPSVPSVPSGAMAAGGAKQVTVTWAAASGATSYNLYWSRTAGVTPATGTKITGAVSPYIQTGLLDGTTYYYVVTAVNSAGESAASAQVSAVTNAPVPTVPSAPTGVTATGGSKQVTVSWSAVSGATSYNLYWSTTAGVTTASGTRIAGVTSPYIHTGRLDSTAYYYIVTAANSAGEGIASAQVSAATAAPALDGAALYAASCQRCHGSLANTDISGRTLQSIKNASMEFGLTDAQLQAIINVLP